MGELPDRVTHRWCLRTAAMRVRQSLNGQRPHSIGSLVAQILRKVLQARSTFDMIGVEPFPAVVYEPIAGRFRKETPNKCRRIREGSFETSLTELLFAHEIDQPPTYA